MIMQSFTLFFVKYVCIIPNNIMIKNESIIAGIKALIKLCNIEMTMANIKTIIFMLVDFLSFTILLNTNKLHK